MPSEAVCVSHAALVCVSHAALVCVPCCAPPECPRCWSLVAFLFTALKSAEACDRSQEGLAGRLTQVQDCTSVGEPRVRFLVRCFSLGPLLSASSRCSGEAAGSHVTVESSQKLWAGFPSRATVVFVPLVYRVTNAVNTREWSCHFS